jgi:hypothetical protein
MNNDDEAVASEVDAADLTELADESVDNNSDNDLSMYGLRIKPEAVGSLPVEEELPMDTGDGVTEGDTDDDTIGDEMESDLDTEEDLEVDGEEDVDE